jgi:hypothetical protein
MDEGQRRELEYRPPMGQLQNAALVILAIAYVFWCLTFAQDGYYNTGWVLGGWFWLFIILLFKWGPAIIENRSPKGVSNKIGTTLASAEPVVVIPAQGTWPELGVWPAKTVRGLGVYAYLTCRGYIICPTKLAYIIGEQNRGVNVFWNCHLEFFPDHRELPPHVLQALKSMRRPQYKPEIPAFFNIRPLMVNNPTPEQIEDFRKQFESIGVVRETFDKSIKPILETYASTLSLFRYKEPLTETGESLMQALRVADADNSRLRSSLEHWMDYATRMEDRMRDDKPVPPPSLMDRMPKMTGQGREDQEQ